MDSSSKKKSKKGGVGGAKVCHVIDHVIINRDHVIVM